MRKTFEHANHVEIPDWCSAHHVQAKGSEDGKVHGCIHLLHEPILLGSGANAIPERHWADESLHEKLACEGEDDYVESHEEEVVGAFAIVSRGIDEREIERPFQRFNSFFGMVGYERVVCRERIGEEESIVDRVGGCRIDSVGGEDDNDNDQRIAPCVSKREGFPASEETFCFSSFRKRAKTFARSIPLNRQVRMCFYVKD